MESSRCRRHRGPANGRRKHGYVNASPLYAQSAVRKNQAPVPPPCTFSINNGAVRPLRDQQSAMTHQQLSSSSSPHLVFLSSPHSLTLSSSHPPPHSAIPSPALHPIANGNISRARRLHPIAIGNGSRARRLHPIAPLQAHAAIKMARLSFKFR